MPMRKFFWFQSAFALLLAVPAPGQILSVGDVVRDFTVIDRANGRPRRLSDFTGRIIVLDFFAQWCGPCRSASADLERNINRYYAERGGNPGRLPIVVIGINVDPAHPERTTDFVRQAGLELVADDMRHEAFGLFDGRNALPLIVVINGAVGVAGRKQWELMYRHSGYDGATPLRRLIDSTRTSGAPPGEPNR
jgi:thiol-disulfide isomerase/thioredoxin